MGNLVELQKGLERLSNESYLLDVLFRLIKKTEKDAIRLQRQQLNDGFDNLERTIGVYTKTTENKAKGRRTRKPKIAGEHYNFEDTGDFFDGMYLIFEQDNVKFFSKDSKTELLEDKYENLFGLTEFNLRNYLNNIILPLMIAAILKETRLLT